MDFLSLYELRLLAYHFNVWLFFVLQLANENK